MMSSGSSDDGGPHPIHLVSIDGPNPNIKPKKRIEPMNIETEKVTDYSKNEVNEDFFRIDEKDRAINNILE